jgi:hypothetical protein
VDFINVYWVSLSVAMSAPSQPGSPSVWFASVHDLCVPGTHGQSIFAKWMEEVVSLILKGDWAAWALQLLSDVLIS